MLNTIILFSGYSTVAKKPGVIIGPIAKFLGIIYNAMFNIIYNISPAYSLGFAIILFTIVIKLVLTPLTLKQQRSAYAMSKLQPEMNKIKKKYAGKKDIESQQKMSLELQKLQKDNNVSMFGGCLPSLIQLPILYALFYIFQQAFNYVDVVNKLYTSITNVLLLIPADVRVAALKGAIVSKKLTIDVASADQLKILISTLSKNDWNSILSSIGTGYATQLTPILTHVHQIEYFFGVSLVSKVGFSFPGILIPVVAGITTYLQTKVMMTKNDVQSDGSDPTAMMSKQMMYFMPVFMGIICFMSPAALGVYWTASNVITTIQTYFINKYYEKQDKKKEAAK